MFVAAHSSTHRLALAAVWLASAVRQPSLRSQLLPRSQRACCSWLQLQLDVLEGDQELADYAAVGHDGRHAVHGSVAALGQLRLGLQRRHRLLQVLQTCTMTVRKR